jgi:hypothetical protein
MWGDVFVVVILTDELVSGQFCRLRPEPPWAAMKEFHDQVARVEWLLLLDVARRVRLSGRDG